MKYVRDVGLSLMRVIIMGAYKYECPHKDCDQIAPGIRKCKDCEKVIITNVGVIQRDLDMSEEWEI